MKMVADATLALQAKRSRERGGARRAAEHVMPLFVWDEHLLASVARDGLRLMTGLFWDIGGVTR